MRNADNLRTSSIRSNTRIVQQSARTISDSEREIDAVYKDMQLEELVSYSGHSGRAIRLPMRFR